MTKDIKAQKRLLAYIGSGPVIERDVKKLTHINIAFGGLRRDGSVSGANHEKVKMLPKFREWNPDIKVLLSFVAEGGQADSFSVCAKDEGLRRKTAENMARLVEETGLDGIDLDWEYPCVPSNGYDVCLEDRENFTLLCLAISEELDKLPGKKMLTIAAGADLYYVKCTELDKLANILDYICLMTYDLKCGFHALAGHHTALYSNRGDVFTNSCDQALRLFNSAGVPKEKLLMGCAFYSRKWENIADRNHGLLQICKNGGGYGPDYEPLEKDYINKNGYVRYWDEEAMAPYLFNGSTFLSYDDEESLANKAKYVVENGYGGLFYWEHKCDTTGKLLDALYRNIKA
ncbi:MAG: chitinase [Lachnospiraceae bacterium]|nr:chitinase [Lachnospiraceae bacterium]